MASAPPDVELSSNFGSPSSVANFLSPVAMGGSSPFTIEAWVRIDSLGTGSLSDALLIAQDSSGLFALVAMNYGTSTYIFAKVSGQYIQGPTLVFGRWFHIALTYDGANVSLIVDGGVYSAQAQALPAVAQVAIAVGPYNGEPGTFDMSDFAIWSVCRTSAQAAGDMWANPVPNTNGLVFYGDFTQNPPVDLCGSTIQSANITLNGETPNLCNIVTGYAIPGAASDFNPSFAAPFTVSAWIAVSGANLNGTNCCIYSNGDTSDPNCWAIVMNGGAVTVGGSQSLTSPSFVAGGDIWYYVAVTYDGATCTIYVDGTATASAPMSNTGPLPPGQSVLFAQSVSQNITNFFIGHMQFFTVWNICLSAAQVQAAMYSDPSDDPTCTGNIICSVNPPADIAGAIGGDTDENDDLQLIGSGIGFDQVGMDDPNFPGPIIPPTSLATMQRQAGSPRTSSSVKGGAPKRAAVRRQHEPAMPVRLTYPCCGSRRGAHARAEPFSDEHVAQMKRDLRAALGAVTDPQTRKRITEQYDRQVDEVFARARSGALQPPYSYARRGDQWVILAHEATGAQVAQVVAAYDVAVTPECAVWWVTFVLTAITGVLQILGIPTPQQRLQNLIAEYVQIPSFSEALSAAIENPNFTAYTLVSVLRVLYSFGLLKRAFWFAISQLSWWAAAKAVAWVVSLVAPAATPQKVMLITNSVILVANLVQQITNYGTACPSTNPAPTR